MFLLCNRLLVLIILLSLNYKVMAYEEAKYTIVFHNDVYEIRSYNERLAIQVNNNNQNGAFRKIFN